MVRPEAGSTWTSRTMSEAGLWLRRLTRGQAAVRLARLLVLVLGLGLLVACPGVHPGQEAATYYVAPNGDDGTSCSAAQHPSSPKRTIRKAIGCLHRGDTVTVADGTYQESILGDDMPNGGAVRVTRRCSPPTRMGPSSPACPAYSSRNMSTNTGSSLRASSVITPTSAASQGGCSGFAGIRGQMTSCIRASNSTISVETMSVA